MTIEALAIIAVMVMLTYAAGYHQGQQDGRQ